MSALGAFENVARTGGFSEAGRQIGLTQSAVSRQISSLETQLGVKLFHRRGQGSVLTPAGEDYLAAIAPALAQVRAATQNLMADCSGQLSLATPPTFGMRWLAPRLNGFRLSCPNVDLVFTARHDDVDLRSEGLDAAVRLGDGQWQGLHADRLFPEAVAPVCAPILASQVKGVEDLRRMDLLVQASRPTAWGDWFECRSLTLGPRRPGLVFEHFMMLIEAAASGAGVALVPTFLVERELSSGALVAVGSADSTPGNAYYLVHSVGHSRTVALEAFRKWILAEADPQPRA